MLNKQQQVAGATLMGIMIVVLIVVGRSDCRIARAKYAKVIAQRRASARADAQPVRLHWPSEIHWKRYPKAPIESPMRLIYGTLVRQHFTPSEVLYKPEIAASWRLESDQEITFELKKWRVNKRSFLVDSDIVKSIDRAKSTMPEIDRIRGVYIDGTRLRIVTAGSTRALLAALAQVPIVAERGSQLFGTGLYAVSIDGLLELKDNGSGYPQALEIRQGQAQWGVFHERQSQDDLVELLPRAYVLKFNCKQKRFGADFRRWLNQLDFHIGGTVQARSPVWPGGPVHGSKGLMPAASAASVATSLTALGFTADAKPVEVLYSENEAAAEATKNALAAVGLTVSAAKKSTDTIAAVLAKGEFDAVLLRWDSLRATDIAADFRSSWLQGCPTPQMAASGQIEAFRALWLSAPPVIIIGVERRFWSKSAKWTAQTVVPEFEDLLSGSAQP